MVNRQRKVGIRFKDNRGVAYCQLNFKGKSTKFPYNRIFDDIQREKEFLEMCIRFLDLRGLTDSFKGIGSKISILQSRISEWVIEGISFYFGDVFSFNQYLELESIVLRNHYDQHEMMMCFLELKGLPKKKYKDLLFSGDHLLKLDKAAKQYIHVYMCLYNFEIKYGIRFLDWYTDYEKLFVLYKEFYGSFEFSIQSKEDISQLKIPFKFHIKLIDDKIQHFKSTEYF